MDLSLASLWKAWYAFRKGKKATSDIDQFSYYLESNLQQLHYGLSNGSYRHGGYRYFSVTDNKRRSIAVAGVRDRVVHRLLYEYLVSIYDKSFIYDAWSCRKGKGVQGAIKRAQRRLGEYPNSYVWRADVTKFFDSVDRPVLIKILSRKVTDGTAMRILKEMIMSYPCLEARSEKREARSEKREARSEKREARSEKREARSEKRDYP